MVVLTMAVLLPTVRGAGFDLIWFGIFIVLVVEMAQITPPVGFNLFVLQGLTKRDSDLDAWPRWRRYPPPCAKAVPRSARSS
jgi:C4-dicarboxylate transporter DctM subunit